MCVCVCACVYVSVCFIFAIIFGSTLITLLFAVSILTGARTTNNNTVLKIEAMAARMRCCMIDVEHACHDYSKHKSFQRVTQLNSMDMPSVPDRSHGHWSTAVTTEVVEDFRSSACWLTLVMMCKTGKLVGFPLFGLVWFVSAFVCFVSYVCLLVRLFGYLLIY